MWSPVELKRRWFPKGVRRELTKLGNRAFRRTSRRSLARSLEPLDIAPGSVICVHSMLSGLGFLADGPDGVLGAIQDAVPGCTIMVPTFAIDDTCERYLRTDPVYDPARTPSTSGLLTEVLWRTSGAVRGLHPTHPCAALGPLANDLIDGTESSVTPFGDDSTYGRFAARDDAILLLLHTNNTSLVHRFQEVAGTPNLFLDGLARARSLMPGGAAREFSIAVHRPKLPLYVIERGDAEAERDHVWLPDYSLPAPEYNRERIERRLSDRTYRFLMDRQRRLLADGTIRTARHRDAELFAIRARDYTAAIVADLGASYLTFADEYELARLEQAERDGAIGK